MKTNYNGHRAIAAMIVFALFAFTKLSVINAQNTLRFYQADKNYLETFFKTGTYNYMMPFLITGPDTDMAFPANFKTARYNVAAEKVTIDNGIASTTNRELEYNIYCNDDIVGDNYEFFLADYIQSKYLKNNKTQMSLASDGTTFTLTFDEDNDKIVYFHANYKKQTADYCLSYNSAENEFFISTENSTGVSIYLFDYVGLTEDAITPDENLDNFNVSVKPDSGCPTIHIKYILNNGDTVTYDGLLASSHSGLLERDKINSGYYTTSLPNYDPEATTIWAMPVDIDNTPYGKMYSLTYADSTTAITDVTISHGNSEIEYYNLQGIRIDRPQSSGIYIMRKGNEVSKIKI